MPKYDHQKIEAKWQKRWEKEKIFVVDDRPAAGKKRYVLDMFPYPSGAGLHVGHPEGYTATDIYCRYLRMNGYKVLHPMGWDAFGLPAENYAIKSGIHPRQSTEQNIKTFTRQIKALGFSYDWSREVNTASVDYYKWTQWLFLQFYKHGLAYKKEAPVNWCDDCQTVLANEQVVDGKCERCGNKVAQKNLEQWFLKITGSDPKGKNGAYPERLLSNLEKLDWPAPIKTMQRNWIGKSEGAELEFPVVIPAKAMPTGRQAGIQNFVILHGKGGSPNKNFFPWLRGQLEAQGFKVQAPTLPHTDEPDDWDQTEFVIKHCVLDEQTVIIGHSFGGVVALRLLERGVKVNKVILAGTPFSGKFLDNKVRPTVTAAVKKGFDFDKIKKQAQNFITLYDENDYAVPLSDGQAFAKNLGGQFRQVVAVEPHFTGDEEPEVLRACRPFIKIFTTRPDTLYGATYMVLAPEHLLIDKLRAEITNWDEVEKYIKKAAAKTQLERTDLAKEKTGIVLSGVKAVNPATGEEIPIWIADYVLMGYGTGAIMAVPAHDERDWEFAKKFGLEIRRVIEGGDLPYVEAGTMTNSGEFNGMDSEEAKWKITEKVGGRKTVQYKLRDWLISRQRYWGAPIPIIYCRKCWETPNTKHQTLKNNSQMFTEIDGEKYAMVPVPDKDLPVELPTDVDFRPHGESPLARSKSFHKVKCPQCGSPARRESDTMDTFVDSSWYFLRYTDPNNKKEFAAKDKIKSWLPVETYVGGAEHAVLHLMYARFFWMALRDLGHIPEALGDEPFLQLRNQGLILGPDGQKMSKSRGNVINPDDVVAQLGADTMRLYEMFMGPLSDAKPWDMNGIIGVRRFLDRVWAMQKFQIPNAKNQTNSKFQMPKNAIERELHKTIKKVGEDIESFSFNTAVAQFMIFVNVVYKAGEISREHFATFLKILSPFAPHLANELWEKLGHKELIEREGWPAFDEKLLVSDSITYVVQINGKTRGTIIVPAQSDEAAVVKAAQDDEKTAKYLAGKQIVKRIFVKGRLINFVVK